MNPILCADSIAKSFRERRVLTSATLRAVPGEVRILLGRNGSGKSTLLKIACGVITADGGAVRFGARVHSTVRFPVLATAGLFYLPDHNLLSTAFTVGLQLEMIRKRYDGSDVIAAASRLGIREHLHKKTFDLSGGELRRVELAAVVVRRPTCVLADEPYRGIPPKDAELLTQVFRDLAADGAAVVITGHEVPSLLDAAHHVTWCTSGTTYELGPPADATRHEAFRREYLGSWSTV